jgi:hypothetical protein
VTNSVSSRRKSGARSRPPESTFHDPERLDRLELADVMEMPVAHQDLQDPLESQESTANPADKETREPLVCLATIHLSH